MIVVAVVSVLLHTALTAFHVGYDLECRWVSHVWERTDDPGDGDRRTTTTVCVAPFWPQYWRRLLGRPWPGAFRCECSKEYRMLAIGRGTECRPHRYLSSRAVSREEAGWVQASLQSLKVVGKRSNPPSVPGGGLHGEADGN
jgi:hypothetical protein